MSRARLRSLGHSGAGELAGGQGQTCGSDPDLLARFPLTDPCVSQLSQSLCSVEERFRPLGLCLLPFLVTLSLTEERRAREWPLETAELSEVHLEDWLEKRAKRLSSAPSVRYSPRVIPPLSSGEAEAAIATAQAQGPSMNPHYRASWEQT